MIALFFFPFLSASSDPFVRNFFVRTEPLAESNPVPQDPISAIHPPCIYAGVALDGRTPSEVVAQEADGIGRVNLQYGDRTRPGPWAPAGSLFSSENAS